MLSEKIKTLRKQARMSQEQLAEKLGVSRQAVTKWETATGVPELENLRAISALFRITIDELLENRANAPRQDFLFDSVTEYDIDCEKSYDINLTAAKQVVLTGYEGEKIQVRLASDGISDIQSAFKVKIDDTKRSIDVDVRRFGTATEGKAKEALYVFIRFPQPYVKNIELTGNTETLTVRNLRVENIELSGKMPRVSLLGVAGYVEFNCNVDMDIACDSLNGRIDVNQVSSVSKLSLPAGTEFLAVTHGIANRILYARDGKPAEAFSCSEEETAADNIIELNGMKSELTVNAVSASLGEV